MAKWLLFKSQTSSILADKYFSDYYARKIVEKHMKRRERDMKTAKSNWVYELKSYFYLKKIKLW